MAQWKFLQELKRRNVFRVAITYAIVAWLLLQIVSVVAPMIEAPAWIGKTVLILLFVGFPIALILAWAFELSPEGIIRTGSDLSKDDTRPESKKKPSGTNILIGLLLVLLIGQWAYNKYWNKGINTSDIEKTIAVLPFKNMSSNMENQHFCDGMTEAVLNHLARIDELSVLSRTSVEQYRNDPPSIPEIAQKLRVNYILEGSVQRQGKEILITAQLIHGPSDVHIWANEYYRNLSDVFKVQAEITKTIATELKTRILPHHLKSIESIPTSNIEAYDL